MTQIATVLAVAPVVISLWTLISTLDSQRWGAYMQDEDTHWYAGNSVKSVRGLYTCT